MFLVSQAHAKIPDDAWEYQIRKSLKDAAYQGLDYVPYCSTMPVPKECENPRFMWVRDCATNAEQFQIVTLTSTVSCNT